jgi:hypothetical protein
MDNLSHIHAPIQMKYKEQRKEKSYRKKFGVYSLNIYVLLN